MSKPTTISEYIDAQPEPQREIADKVRAIIDAALPTAGSGLYQAHPVWARGTKLGQDPICLLKAYPKYVTFGFWQGQAINDGTGRLESGGRGMASVKLHSLADIDPAQFTNWLNQASDYEPKE